MKKRGWGARDLSKASGVAYTTIRSMLERDFVNASIDNTSNICIALGITMDELISEKKESEVLKESQYPYIHTSISAGLPENIDGVTAEDSISIPDSVMGRHAGGKGIQMMRINGESMNRVIPNGSLIAVKKVSLENLKNGDVVVYGDDHAYSVKRFHKVDKHLVFRPDSTDDRFDDYITPADESVEIVGKVVVYVVELD